MHRSLPLVALGTALLIVLSACSSQEAVRQDRDACDAQTGENCGTAQSEQQAAERGFDPCLVNSNLPACDQEGTGK